MNKNFILLCLLFFSWAIAHNLNPILIPQIKTLFQLSDFQSAWVDSAFYIAYSLFAIPAGFVIQKLGYKRGIQIGLLLFALGTITTGYATLAWIFPLALFALFILAIGLTLLETSANPLVAISGNYSTASQRLTLAQSFNGLGATLAAFFGGQVIFSNPELSKITVNQLKKIQSTAPSYEYSEILEDLALPVFLTYFWVTAFILFVLILISFFFKIAKAPRNQEVNSHKFNERISTQQSQPKNPHSPIQSTLKSLLQHRNFKQGMIALGLYVGAQIGIGSFFIRYSQEYSSMSKNDASVLLSMGLLLFMIGRFIGSALMKYISAPKLLEICASSAAALTAFAIFTANTQSPISGLYCLILAQLFMSIMFPVIFSISLQQIPNPPPLASSLLIMTIGGGALLPPGMGLISDSWGLNYAFILPLLAFAYISYFANKIIKSV
ncbi:MAG: L-fucose:H+ symporter permease [Bacteroidota bacterium]|jgi:FHS family L-fucose permease-like MFS transporter